MHKLQPVTAEYRMVIYGMSHMEQFKGDCAVWGFSRDYVSIALKVR